MSTAKTVVEQVLSDKITKKLWTSIYQLALPFTPQSFSLGAVLPAVFYMFRWGHRRGKGTFVQTFGTQQDGKWTSPTIENVAANLAQQKDTFEGFTGTTEQAILGDLLLSFCLENKNHSPGRAEQIQRVHPTHYLASWIDLPIKLGHLRSIPEMLVALLANQDHGEFIQANNHQSPFGVASGFEDNVLLRLFGRSMRIKGEHQTDLTSDQFAEDDDSDTIGLDQLLTVRIAQACGGAPQKARGTGDSDKIPNQYPLSKIAARIFREDFTMFVQSYGNQIPRQAFLQMLESCLALGLTNIYFSTARMLLEWEKQGKLPQTDRPWPLFVDCSNGNDLKLRAFAEESFDDFLRRFDRVPVIMMCLRILDDVVRFDRVLRDQIPQSHPDGTEWINLLGEVFSDKHSRSEKIMDDLDEKCLRLADAFKEGDMEQAAQDRLQQNGVHPAIRLAETLTLLMGKSQHNMQAVQAPDSCLMINEPNGLARKRKILRMRDGKRVSGEARSVVLTNSMLDFLVHRHLCGALNGGNRTQLAFIDLIQILRDDYGLYIDQEPPGLTVPIESLHHNRRLLERRLRDMGLLVGVNDAESMKHLQARFSMELSSLDDNRSSR